jgi:SRSO17 transposase
MSGGIEERFQAYCQPIVQTLAHADRQRPAAWYLKGLMLPGERKSVEPMAARVCPHHVRAAHQSMHHRVAEAELRRRGRALGRGAPGGAGAPEERRAPVVDCR